MKSLPGSSRFLLRAAKLKAAKQPDVAAVKAKLKKERLARLERHKDLVDRLNAQEQEKRRP